MERALSDFFAKIDDLSSFSAFLRVFEILFVLFWHEYKISWVIFTEKLLFVWPSGLS